MRSIISILSVFVLLTMFNGCYSQQQDEDRFIVRTVEKSPVQTEVINLRRLLLSNGTADSSSADFSLAKRDEFPYMYFLINHSSRGILTIRKEIDRDQLCRLRRCRCDTWCDLELEIFVNNDQFSIEVITIRILDQNDHSPKFAALNNQLNLTIVESAPIGAVIKFEPAIDYDQGKNGIIGYSLLPSTSLPFSLRFDVARADLSLVVEGSLDRELLSSYQFDIIAYDGSNRTGVLHVYVTIADVNDCPPKFEQSSYVLKNISENLPIGSTIIRVHANDDDQGVNGEITYHFINRDRCFEIDQTTGDVRTVCVLDYEVKITYRLDIEARDNGEGFKTDYCTLVIYLLDENDNYPIIDFYPTNMEIDSNTIKLYLSESLPIHSLILSLTITDRDAGDNGRVTWKLERSVVPLPFELMRVTENTGELRTNRLLDRESLAQYLLVLDATDHGKPKPRSSRLNIQIHILDENDNRPQFEEENIRTTISEHVPVTSSHGYEVYHIRAKDFDQNRNGEIFYSILNKDNPPFQIDSRTGMIRAMKEFDRKQKDSYTLNIQARDKGSPSLSSETTITFTIVPSNENSPICDLDHHKRSVSIMENRPQGTIINIISCRDEDEDELNGQMSVSVRWWPEEKQENKRQGLVPFDILTRKSNSSQSILQILIVVNGSIDRELISYYPLLLTVSDNGNPARSTTISLSIEVLDENDHCPQLHIESSFLMINRDITRTEYIVHLIASDLDQGSNGQITFELSPLTSPGFVILFANGTLLIQTNSNLIENDILVVLHVQIRDHGLPTPCLIVETLRLFIGSNRTDWFVVLKNHDQTDEASLRLVTDQFQQGKRMVHAFSTPSNTTSSSSSSSSSFVQHFLSLTTRKRLYVAIIGSSIFISVILLVVTGCFVDRLLKRTIKRKPLIKSNGIGHASPHNSANGKRIASSSPVKTRFCYEDDSPTHNYTSFKALKPVVVVAAVTSSSSQSSSSSVDSTTRANTAHNRALNMTYSYTALGTSDELIPVDFDEDNEDIDSGVELMMTTV